MKKRMHLVISGRVQGVCYRMYACQEASRFDLTGWVRNLHDESVEIVAEGDEDSLGALLLWCRKGPPSAYVAGIKEGYSKATGEFDSFVVRY